MEYFSIFPPISKGYHKKLRKSRRLLRSAAVALLAEIDTNDRFFRAKSHIRDIYTVVSFEVVKSCGFIVAAFYFLLLFLCQIIIDIAEILRT